MLDFVAQEPDEVRLPWKPNPPNKTFEYHRSFDLKYGHDYSIKELKSLLPDNVSINDIRIKYTSSDNGCDIHEYVAVYWIEKKANPNYQDQMKSYRRLMKVYNKETKEYDAKKKIYLEKLKEYISWVESVNCNRYVNLNRIYFLKEKYGIE